MELLIFTFALLLVYRYWGRSTTNVRVRHPETLKKSQRLKQKIQSATKRWQQWEKDHE